MHYYQFNIGDYASHTRHLTLMEDLAYRKLLDEYYLHERPLNSGIASVARQIGMRENESEVKVILEEFFKLTGDGWINTRADKEIQAYKSKISQASNAGKASAQRRFNAGSTDVQPNTKQEPLTINQEPISVAKATAGKPAKITEPNEIIFGYGLPMLTNAGTPEKQARSFLGGLRKRCGDDILISKLRECAMQKPLQPLEWLAAALPPTVMMNAQEKLEAGNSAVLKRFMEKDNAKL